MNLPLSVCLARSEFITLCFRMSVFDSSSSEAELSKLRSSDHNMNTSAAAELPAFPFPSFPKFPFLPVPSLSQDSLPTTPLSLSLTGQLEASPRSAESDESPKSSPTGKGGNNCII